MPSRRALTEATVAVAVALPSGAKVVLQAMPERMSAAGDGYAALMNAGDGLAAMERERVWEQSTMVARVVLARRPSVIDVEGLIADVTGLLAASAVKQKRGSRKPATEPRSFGAAGGRSADALQADVGAPDQVAPTVDAPGASVLARLEEFRASTVPSDEEALARLESLTGESERCSQALDEAKRAVYRNHAERIVYLCSSWDVTETDEADSPMWALTVENLMTFSPASIRTLLDEVEKKVQGR